MVVRLVGQQRSVKPEQMLDRDRRRSHEHRAGLVQDSHVVGDKLGLGRHVRNQLAGAEFGQRHLLD